MKRKTAAVAAICAVLGAKGAGAEEMFSVRGFSTMGVVHSSEHHADFVNNVFNQHRGAGASDDWSADVDSKWGAQLDAQFSSRWSAVVQIIAEDQKMNGFENEHNPRFRPALEWANVKYALSDDLSVRAGRIVLPLLFVSDSRKVGYANSWVRPPIELYGFLPLTGSDGVDATYKARLGGVSSTWNVLWGKQTQRNAGRGDSAVHPETFGINATFGVGDLAVRAGYTHVTIDLQRGVQEVSGTIAFMESAVLSPSGAAQSAALRARYLDSETVMKNYALAIAYDPGKWFAQAELLHLDSDKGLVGSADSGYVMGGVRLGAVTPYAMWSRIDQDARSVAVSDPSGAAVNGIYAAVLNADMSQSTLAAGVRWDLTRNVAAKFQYQRVALDEGSVGLYGLFSQDARFKPGRDANIISLAIDFVF